MAEEEKWHPGQLAVPLLVFGGFLAVVGGSDNATFGSPVTIGIGVVLLIAGLVLLLLPKA